VVRNIGFLALNFGDIFIFAVVSGLLLYGVCLLVQPRDQQKAGDSKHEDHSGDMANLVP
jgi:hypothetical protein